jgi:hypothetical protein
VNKKERTFTPYGGKKINIKERGGNPLFQATLSPLYVLKHALKQRTM